MMSSAFAGIEALGDRLDIDERVDARDRVPRALDLQPPDVGLSMHDLALQIVDRDAIVVDDADRPDARRRQVHQDGRAEPARADDEHARRFQLLLTRCADVAQHKVALVALHLVGGQCHHGVAS